MRLRGALHRMIAGIDPRHRGNRAEPADAGIGNVAVVDDVGIVAERDLQQRRSLADFRVFAEDAVADIRAWMQSREAVS